MSTSVLIGGGSGLVGARLTAKLTAKGYHVHILSRSKKTSDNPLVTYHRWDLDTMSIDEKATNVDHIINLTGAGIADARWTDKRKQVLISSRVNSAKLILKNLEETGHRPKSYISASAVGYYGDRGQELLTEQSDAGTGFMSECCVAWEEAALLLKPMVDRHIINRIGIVLSSKGGALPKILMTRPILSYFGDGHQYYPWIHIDDLCEVFIEGVEHTDMKGVYNATTLLPVTNKEFTKQIQKAIGGLVLPAPAFALRLAMGEMADVVLNSNRVIPEELSKQSFKYKFTDLGTAVKDLQERKI